MFGLAKLGQKHDQIKLKKSSLRSENVYSNRRLGKARSCRKRLRYYLTRIAIGLMTLLIPPTRKMSSAAAKLEMRRAFDCQV